MVASLKRCPDPNLKFLPALCLAVLFSRPFMSRLREAQVSSMTAVVLVYLGLLIGLVGVVATVKPPGFLRIRSRSRKALVLVVGVAMVIAGFALPAPESRISAPVTRLDEFAPFYQFDEFHSTRIAAPAARVYAAVREVTPGEI